MIHPLATLIFVVAMIVAAGAVAVTLDGRLGRIGDALRGRSVP